MKEKLKTMFTRNLGMKLLSILIAMLLWIIIMSLSDPKITVTIENISVEKRNEEAVTKENMVYEALSGDKVDIKIRGARSVVENLTVSDFDVYVDFQEIGWVNAVPIHVELKDKELESYVDVTYQSDSVMGISLVENLTDMVMIEVTTKNVESGYYAFCSSVSSKLLEVTGSKTQVESVEKLVAEVDLTGITENYSTTAKLSAVDSEGNELDESKVTIAQNLIQVEITVLPVKEVPLVIDTTETGCSSGFGIANVEYSPKTLQIAAKQDTLDDLLVISIPYEAEGLMEAEEREIDIQKYLPEGVYLKSETSVVYVSIDVELLGNKSFVVPTDNIEIRNLDEQFVVNVTQNSITVPVYGIASQLEEMGFDDLKLYIDMSSCKAIGMYNVVLRSDSGKWLEFDTKLSVYVTKAQ